MIAIPSTLKISPPEGQLIRTHDQLLNLVRDYLKDNYALVLDIFTKIRTERYILQLVIDRKKAYCVFATIKGAEGQEKKLVGKEAIELFHNLLQNNISLLIEAYGINEVRLTQIIASNDDVCSKTPKISLHELFKAPENFVFYEEKKILELTVPPQYRRVLEFRLKALILEFSKVVPNIEKVIFTMTPKEGAEYIIEATFIVGTKDLEYPRRILTYLFDKHILKEFRGKGIKLWIQNIILKASILGVSVEHIVGLQKEITHSNRETSDMIRKIMGENESKLIKAEPKPIKTKLTGKKEEPKQIEQIEEARPSIEESLDVKLNNTKLKQILLKKKQIEEEVNRLLAKAEIKELNFLAEDKKKELLEKAKKIAPKVNQEISRVIREFFEESGEVSLQWSKIDAQPEDNKIWVDVKLAVKSEETVGFFGVGVSEFSEDALKEELLRVLYNTIKQLKARYNIPISIRELEIKAT